MDDKRIKKIVNDVHIYLTDACGAVAADLMSLSPGFLDNKWKTKIKQAKKAEIKDLEGWLADECWNNPETLEDLMGDKISWETKSEEEFQAVLNELDKVAHPAMQKAILNMRRTQLN